MFCLVTGVLSFVFIFFKESKPSVGSIFLLLIISMCMTSLLDSSGWNSFIENNLLNIMHANPYEFIQEKLNISDFFRHFKSDF